VSFCGIDVVFVFDILNRSFIAQLDRLVNLNGRYGLSNKVRFWMF